MVPAHGRGGRGLVRRVMVALMTARARHVSEPAATSRKTIGIVVLFFLVLVLVPLTYWLKKEFWKDVK